MSKDLTRKFTTAINSNCKLFSFSDHSIAGFIFTEVDGMWYYYSYQRNNWYGATNDCRNNRLNSTLPVLKSAAQIQLGFDYWDRIGKIFCTYVHNKYFFSYKAQYCLQYT